RRNQGVACRGIAVTRAPQTLVSRTSSMHAELRSGPSATSESVTDVGNTVVNVHEGEKIEASKTGHVVEYHRRGSHSGQRLLGLGDRGPRNAANRGHRPGGPD